MKDIKIIALDLDGTLLNKNKEVSTRNLNALRCAAEKGIEIVPTTGRFYGAMPQCIRELPYLHYAITINGAQVYDIEKDLAVAKSEIPLDLSLKLMSYLDTLPVIYDCYMDNWGYMTRTLWEKAEEYTPDPHYQKMIRELRKPVPDLKELLREGNHSTQKIQLFTPDDDLRRDLLLKAPELFPELLATTSAPANLEFNTREANKGHALKQLADYLHIDIQRTASFGDGSNDLSMIKDAGVGVAMKNSCREVLDAADEITLSNDEDGVAVWIENNLL